MSWYVAHVIMGHRLKNDPEDCIHVWENLYLLEGSTLEELTEKATQCGKDSIIDDPTFTVDGKPAREEFVGIRKIIEIQNGDGPPHSGTELTFSAFVVKSEEDLRLLANGDDVEVLYRE
jgi:hypothetical protein